MREAVDQVIAAADASGTVPLVTIEHSAGPGCPNRRTVHRPRAETVSAADFLRQSDDGRDSHQREARHRER